MIRLNEYYLSSTLSYLTHTQLESSFLWNIEALLTCQSQKAEVFQFQMHCYRPRLWFVRCSSYRRYTFHLKKFNWYRFSKAYLWKQESYLASISRKVQSHPHWKHRRPNTLSTHHSELFVANPQLSPNQLLQLLLVQCGIWCHADSWNFRANECLLWNRRSSIFQPIREPLPKKVRFRSLITILPVKSGHQWQHSEFGLA